MSLDWVELVADYRCNQACTGCYSAGDARGSMTTAAALDVLRSARARGAQKLWLGGGEPTLRPDLLGLVRAARRLGYTRVKVQTNGMRLAYVEYARALREAGVTECALSIKGATAAQHDAITHTPDAFALLVRGLEACLAVGLDVEADVLVYASTVASLDELVRGFHARGVRVFRVWSFTARYAEGLDAETPRLVDVASAVARTLGAVPDVRLDALHVPPCLLLGDAARARFHAPSLRLEVVDPGGHRFRLEDSPVEGGTYAPACASCALRPRCGGLREEYVARFGFEELAPVA